MLLHILLHVLVKVEHQVVVDHRVFKRTKALSKLLGENRLFRDLLTDAYPIVLVLTHLQD